MNCNTSAPNLQFTTPAGLAGAADVRDIERRYLSALWHSPIPAFNAAYRHDISGESFGGFFHRDVYAALAARARAYSQDGRLDSFLFVACVLRRLGATFTDAALANILECECSGAGAENFAAILARAARRRRQAARLWRALRDIEVDPIGDRAERSSRGLDVNIRRAQREAVLP